MKHLIKAISITLGLAFCASPVMAQFPKIPKVKVPKVNLGNGGGKDPVKTVTGNTGNNSAGNKKDYEAAISQGYALKKEAKYLEAAAIFDKAAGIAPTQSEYSSNKTDEFKKDAEKGATECRTKDANCKAGLTKIDALAAEKKYEDGLSTLRAYGPVADQYDCRCLLPQAEVDKIKAKLNKGIADEKQAAADLEAANEEKELATKFALVPDDGVKGTLHKTHVNKIVFSKTPLTENSPESALANTFNLGDDIYFRVFLDKSPSNNRRAARKSNEEYITVSLSIFIDGVNMSTNRRKEFYDLSGLPTRSFKSNTSTTGLEALSHNWGAIQGDAMYIANPLLTDFYYATNKLPAGAHKVKVVYNETNITAEFTLNVTEAGKLTLGKKICTIPIIKKQHKDYNKSLRLVPNAASLLGKYEGSTLIKVVETETAWVYRKNNYGIVTRRVLDGVAYYKENSTGLYHAEAVQFVEENISSGGSRYAPATCSIVNDPEISGYRFCKECLGK
jgi:hypothetical protein